MCGMSDDPSMHDAPEPRDPALVIEERMNRMERGILLANFYSANRGWRGAQVADILDNLRGVDSDLDLVEPLIRAYPEIDPALLGTAVRAAVWVTEAFRWGATRSIATVEPMAVRLATSTGAYS